MIAVVTGASGLLGGNLAIELLRQGHRVRATRRRTSRIDHLAAFNVQWCVGDLSDEPALTKAFAGADVVFHCAADVSIRRAATPQMTRANVDGTRSVVAAVRAAGGPRLVHCSTVATVGVSEDGRPCTEDARWNFHEHGLSNGYVVTKRQAEEIVQQAVGDGLDAVIVNPTYMLGPYDARPSSGRLIVDVIKGRVPRYPPGFNNFVDVRDVARGAIRVWQRGETGNRYILGGPNLPYSEVIALIASIAGVRAPRRPIPQVAASLLGFAGDVAEFLGAEPPFNSIAVRYGFTNRFQFSSGKAASELGYTYGPLETAVADAIAWFRIRKKETMPEPGRG